MTTQTTDIKKVIKNTLLLRRKMDALSTLFEKNLTLLTALTNGHTPAQATAASGDPLSEQEKAIVSAMATLAVINRHIVPRQWLAIVARISPKSGMYRTALASLLKRGMLVKAGTGSVRAGETLVAFSEPGPLLSVEEILRRFASMSKPPEADILHYLAVEADATKIEWVDRKTLAERTGQSFDSSSFRERLTQFRENGLIEYGRDSTVRATLQWFTRPVSRKATA